MPRRNDFQLDDNPLYLKGKKLRMSKAYTSQDFSKQTVLTDDAFTYVSFYYSSHRKSMKFSNPANAAKYGNANQYGYEFYWKQSEIFYNAAKDLPIEAAPVAAYYCMLNAAKSYLAYTCNTADEFVEEFGMHGLQEDHHGLGENAETIAIKHKQKGVFPLFAKKLDADFFTKWPVGTSKSLKSLLYNLPFVHRAYSMTYSSKKGKVDELFLPLNAGDFPKYQKANDGKAYLVIDLEKDYFATNAQTIPSSIVSSLSGDFRVLNARGFKLISVDGARRNKDSISGEMKDLTNKLRKHLSYIRGTRRLWYIKRTNLANPDVINLSSLTINMAAMHRVSEIARYKPEQLSRLMKSKENWLLHEYISQSLDQFIDELASEITKQDIMCVGQKSM